MNKLNIAVLGATGLVGSEMVKLLEKSKLPIGELRLLSFHKGVGRRFLFRNRIIESQKISEDSFKDMHIILGAVSSENTKKLLPCIMASDAYFIDNSSLLRLHDSVPLVISGINDSNLKGKKLIASPNCSTIIALEALYPIGKVFSLKGFISSTYQAVSGCGKEGLLELERAKRAESCHEIFTPSVFKEKIEGNIIPLIGSLNDEGYSLEEMKMISESKKILKDESLKISCTAVRVPVKRCHSISIDAFFEKDPSVEEIKEIYSSCPYIELLDEDVPTPLKTEGRDKIQVGRIRKNKVFKNGVSIFCTGDQLIRGAALNAVKIAENVKNFI